MWSRGYILHQQPMITFNIYTAIGNIILLLYSFHLMGIVEAILYSQKGSNAFPGNEHTYFTLDRFSLFFIACLPNSASIVLCTFLLFPLIHDGAYYYGRHLIDPLLYPKGWLSEPDTINSAKINISLAYRVSLGICGVVAILVVGYLTFFH